MQIVVLTNPDTEHISAFEQNQTSNYNTSESFIREVVEFHTVCTKCQSSTDASYFDFPPRLPITNHLYDQLVVYIFEHMEHYHCHSITKYLAKIYIDFYLKSNQQITLETFGLLGASAMLLAIKFNQSFDYSPSLIVSNMGLSCSPQDIIDFELKLLRVLNFKLKQVTPYCFINILKKYVPQTEGISTYRDLEAMIELSAIDLRLSSFSAREIFIGCTVELINIQYGEGDFSDFIGSLKNFSPAIPLIVQILDQQVGDCEGTEESVTEIN